MPGVLAVTIPYRWLPGLVPRIGGFLRSGSLTWHDRRKRRTGVPVTSPWLARRRFGHPQDMETGRRADCGACAAVDVHYLRTGGAQAAAVLAADAAFAHALAERTAVVPRVPPYRRASRTLARSPAAARGRPLHPGASSAGRWLDGYADLDPGGLPGLGAHVLRRVRHPGDRGGQVQVLDLQRLPHTCGVVRPSSAAPSFVTAAGTPVSSTRRTWSGAWPAGTGCPTHCAAPTPSRAQVRPQPP